MANTKLTVGGNAVTFWWAAASAFAAEGKPTVAEVNAALNLLEATSTENFSVGTQASNQTSDPSYADTGNSQTRGLSQFGGTAMFFYPQTYAVSATDVSYLTWAALRTQWTPGYMLVRVDGQKTTTGAADPTKGIVSLDIVSVYKVMSDGWDDSVEGESAFKYQITFLPQGTLYVNAVVSTAAVTVVTPVAVGATAYTVGGKTALASYITGRQLALTAAEWNGYPGWFTWASSDTTKATVSKAGVVTGVAAGATTITATWPATGTVSTGLVVTIV